MEAVGGSVLLRKALLGGASAGAFARQLPDVLKKKKTTATATPISCHYRSTKLSQSPLSNSPFLSVRKHGTIQLLSAAPPPSCLPAEVEVHTETIGSSTEEIYEPSTEETVESPTEQADQLSTARVKFVLKKECSYGEQFLLVGDDPVLGEWNPSAALPMTWSEGHIWTTELDLPIDKLFKFKYILKDAAGEINWQPGPNREFQTYETADTITVSEEWETAEEEEEEEQVAPKDDEQQQPLPVEEDTPAEPEPVIAAEGADQHEEKYESPTEGASSIEEEQTPVLVPGLTAETKLNSGAENKEDVDDADIDDQEI